MYLGVVPLSVVNSIASQRRCRLRNPEQKISKRRWNLSRPPWWDSGTVAFGELWNWKDPIECSAFSILGSTRNWRPSESIMNLIRKLNRRLSESAASSGFVLEAHVNYVCIALLPIGSYEFCQRSHQSKLPIVGTLAPFDRCLRKTSSQGFCKERRQPDRLLRRYYTTEEHDITIVSSTLVCNVPSDVSYPDFLYIGKGTAKPPTSPTGRVT